MQNDSVFDSVQATAIDSNHLSPMNIKMKTLSALLYVATVAAADTECYTCWWWRCRKNIQKTETETQTQSNDEALRPEKYQTIPFSFQFPCKICTFKSFEK